jgi:methylated-DNA-[protein]-cysteine S-methyltransferase
MNATINSPVGPLGFESDGEALTAIRFLDQDSVPTSAPNDKLLDEAARQLRAYLAGELREFDLPLRPTGTEFQLLTWRTLQTVPYGGTISYAELARRVGKPRAVRAVGAANGQNPLAIVLPCHRVIGSDGSLTGYGGGLPIKRWLLELEDSHARRAR